MATDQPTDAKHITRVVIDRELCIGAATCIAVAPEAFALDEENKAIELPDHQTDDETLLNAAKVCPVNAIYLYNSVHRRIYPDPKV